MLDLRETAKAEDVKFKKVTTDDSYLAFCIDNSRSMAAPQLQFYLIIQFPNSISRYIK